MVNFIMIFEILGVINRYDGKVQNFSKETFLFAWFYTEFNTDIADKPELILTKTTTRVSNQFNYWLIINSFIICYKAKTGW